MNTKRLFWWPMLALWSVVLGTAMAQPSTPVSPELAALQELYARIEMQRKILDEQRSMLKTNIGEGVTLPSGAISRADNPILLSAIYYVSYDSLRSLAQQICTDIASTPPPSKTTP